MDTSSWLYMTSNDCTHLRAPCTAECADGAAPQGRAVSVEDGHD
ncbi:hypothetical protein HMPREF3223_02175 [Cutibacterium avidum]|uniref:Uncharacterized protein n=1 Tax=Cutibacterium avidum ATCC 25577 TaxID=997355 RepID=G4CV46_9ACTN|nr:hypothetical protein HMPREF9153_0403 [Cutibacterium avidum ATCC 25577]KXA66052.1 hypothetical protein HMPREF3223_02175 [Cutibacterium avidum]